MSVEIKGTSEYNNMSMMTVQYGLHVYCIIMK